MALAEVQRALATVATNEAARDRLRDEPEAFAREFALAPGELAQLRAIDRARVLAYVDSLQRKRVAEAVRLLPLCARADEATLRRAFRRHARRVPLGGGELRYVRDVLTFARRATRDRGEPPVFRELLDYEATWLRAASARALIRLRTYAFPVRRVARAVAHGEPWEGSRRRRTIVVWLAAGGIRGSLALG